MPEKRALKGILSALRASQENMRISQLHVMEQILSVIVFSANLDTTAKINLLRAHNAPQVSNRQKDRRIAPCVPQESIRVSNQLNAVIVPLDTSVQINLLRAQNVTTVRLQVKDRRYAI